MSYSQHHQLIMKTYLVFLCFLSEAHSVNVVANGDSSAYFNAEASFTCTLADPTGVLQVTWQRLFKDESVENLATYSKRFGPQIIEPHKNKVVLREASLNSTSITLKNVSWSDEACYICSFNVYPSGSRRKQTCLTVQGVSEVGTTLQQVSSSESNRDGDVVVSCSATGRPAPSIQWDYSTPGSIQTLSNWNVTNSDQTVTVVSNITLRLSPGLGGHVDCLVNNGTRTQTRQQVLLPLHLGKNKDEPDDTSPLGVAIPVLLIISFFGVFVYFMHKKKKVFREAVLATPAEEQHPFGCNV
ncbi:OX-2 membrane glycoprotein [Esox lucius]|uniref:OX-2 membrane glycoprotein n=1 Tax=Esox lucius TaxID=8010 RepID=UPI000576E92A|nr:OX-2 membrane glycoprotein [Esox lucius]